MNYLRLLYPMNKALIFLMGTLAVVTIWFFDYRIIGPEITFTLLYLIPIAFVTWFGGRKPGFILSLFSSAAWFSIYATQTPYSPLAPVSYLNLTTKTLLYIAFVYILSTLRTSLTREKEAARTDYLTGGANRKAFIELLSAEASRADRYGRPLTIVFMDVDNFKAVNDTFGHPAGDRLLLLIVETIRQNIRRADSVARMGGDEFAVLLPELELIEAETVASKIQSKLLQMVAQNGWPVTFSMGVATCRKPPRSPETLLKQADSLMYSAKLAGKNTIKHGFCDT